MLAGAAAAWPLRARAQQSREIRRIGILIVFEEIDPDAQSSLNALVQGLREYGWSDGRNIRIDYRWGAAEHDRGLALAKELVAMQPDLMVACGGPAAAALSQAHPGGNLTGIGNRFADFGRPSSPIPGRKSLGQT